MPRFYARPVCRAHEGALHGAGGARVAGVTYFLEHAPSLAIDFANSIDRALMRLLDHPYSAQETEKRGIRRVYIRRFHYSIFYTIEGDEIVILHLRHAARRAPWQGL